MIILFIILFFALLLIIPSFRLPLFFITSFHFPLPPLLPIISFCLITPYICK
ncbi:hypothetical protein C1646_443544 [Rhizophagus diaphanus]|nr:hypothetical protein C1646_443544 [Rhizophagus diaphanus] [Rhizophagus sp. MUCL 43196]